MGRTFPYRKLLPYTVEESPDDFLDYIVSNLERAHHAGALTGNSSGNLIVHWTRELVNWFKLKPALAVDKRVRLIQLYFDILLHCTDAQSAERVGSILAKLAPKQDDLQDLELGLDFEKFFAVLLKTLPANFSRSNFRDPIAKCIAALSNLGYRLHIMSSPAKLHQYITEVLSYATIPQELSGLIMSALTILLIQVPGRNLDQVLEYVPLLFRLWEFAPAGSMFTVLGLLSSKALLGHNEYEPGEYGIFSQQQMDLAFASIYQFLKFSAGRPHAASKHSPSLLDSSYRTCAAALVVTSITDSNKVLGYFATLVKSMEPFCHPSSTEDHHTQVQLLGFLVDCVDGMVDRKVQQHRLGAAKHLSDATLANFTQVVLEPLLYGLYSKSRALVMPVLPAMYKLAYIAPHTVLPRLLADIYPSLQGFYTPHRTYSCLGVLAAIVPIMVRHPQYAFHLTSLLELVVPCIDANDPFKAMLAARVIQTASLYVPFVPLSESMELAIEHVSQVVAGMEDARLAFVYPEYTPDDATSILVSSTANFESLASNLLDQCFLLFENMPEKSSSDSPELDLSYFVPYMLGCVLNSVSPAVLNKLADKMVEFITSNTLPNAVEAVAQVCNKFIYASPCLFGKFFAVLDTNLRHEVDENAAGQSRSFTHRDRTFVWYVSILNVILVVAGPSLLEHRGKVEDLVMFLRTHTRGESVYHVSFTIHHTIVALVSSYCVDYHTIDHKASADDWGRAVDLEALSLTWYTPSRAELEFAVEFYETHTSLSMSSIEAAKHKQFATPTEFSDYIANNCTYLRTCIGAIAPLSRGPPPTPLTGNEPYLDEDGDVNVDILHLARGSITCGPSVDASILEKVEALRTTIGTHLLETLQFLQQHHESDSTALKSLLFAIKLWFCDVGVEKSARHDQYFRSIYAAEKRAFNIDKTHKQLLPRPMLARRAMLYHMQRLNQNGIPRKMSVLERQLIQQLVGSVMSELPQIRFHAQCSLYAAIKATHKSRALAYGAILDATEAAISEKEYGRAESGMQFLMFRSMPSVAHRQYKHLAQLWRVLGLALASDHDKLSAVAFELGQRQQAITGGYSAELVSLDPGEPMGKEAIGEAIGEAIVHEIDDPKDADGLEGTDSGVSSDSEDASTVVHIQEAMRSRQDAVNTELRRVHDYLVQIPPDAHRRFHMVSLEALSWIVQSPQTVEAGPALSFFAKRLTSTDPLVKDMADMAFIKCVNRIWHNALAGYDPETLRLGCDDRNYDHGKSVESATALAELKNTARPQFFFDSKFDTLTQFSSFSGTGRGWLLWHPTIKMAEPAASDPRSVALSESDRTQLQQVGVSIDAQWFQQFLGRIALEPRKGEDHFQVSNALVLEELLLMVNLGVTTLKLEDLRPILQSVDCDDRNWQRALAELSFALAMSLKCCSQQDLVVELLQHIQDCVLSGQFSLDALVCWTSYYEFAHAAIDHRRIWPALAPLHALRIGPSSSIKDVYRLRLRTSLFKAQKWKYHLEDTELIFNLAENFNHPLEAVRLEVAEQLAAILQTRFHYCRESIGDLASSDGEALALLEQAWAKMDTSSALAGHAACVFIRTLLGKSLSSPQAVDMVVSNGLALLLQLTMSRDTPELVVEVTKTFETLSEQRMPAQTLDMLAAYSTERFSWHQKMRWLLFLQAVYNRNFFRFSPEKCSQVLDGIKRLLLDQQIEVRELAAQVLRDWVMCVRTDQRPQVVAKLVATFTACLGDPQQQHGGALGLGALIAAYPYETPLPAFIPPTLSRLVRSLSRGGAVNKSIKKIFGDFKRTRQDSWHLDQAAFSQDELDDLDGVLFKNYLV